MGNATLHTIDGVTCPATAEAIENYLASGEFFWARFDGVDDADRELLLNSFKFHPLAVEDAEHFGQRPKVEAYDGFSYWVAIGVDDAGDAVEMHVFFTEKFLVSVRHDGKTLVDEVYRRFDGHPLRRTSPPAITVLYLILDTLIDSYFPRLSDLDDRIDQLEDEILARPSEDQLGELFDMKRRLVTYRKAITPQRDMIARVLTSVDVGPELTQEDMRYFRDIYDHLIRISDLVDSYRDLVSGAVDTHISMVSNRLNVIMKQLTIIATVFLPLSFLTGFFGQNFGYMVNGVQNRPWAFWVFGVGIEVTATVGLLLYGRTKGWFGGPSA